MTTLFIAQWTVKIVPGNVYPYLRHYIDRFFKLRPPAHCRKSAVFVNLSRLVFPLFTSNTNVYLDVIILFY